MTDLDKKKKDLLYPRFASDMPDDDTMTRLYSEVTVLSEAAQASYQNILFSRHHMKQNKTGLLLLRLPPLLFISCLKRLILTPKSSKSEGIDVLLPAEDSDVLHVSAYEVQMPVLTILNWKGEGKKNHFFIFATII